MIQEDDNQFVLIFWCHVRSPRQFIGLICVTRFIHQLNVVVSQFHDISVDLQANFLGLAIILEIGVVGDNHDGVHSCNALMGVKARRWRVGDFES